MYLVKWSRSCRLIKDSRVIPQHPVSYSFRISLKTSNGMTILVGDLHESIEQQVTTAFK